MCEHCPSPVIGYNWETDTFYCNVCDKEFKIEEGEYNKKENSETIKRDI